MKKLITTIVSLVLAGTMTFGLAACNNNGGTGGTGGGGGGAGGGGGGGQTEEQKWAAMVEGLRDLDNFTATSTSTSSQGLKFNGEYVTADTVYSEDPEEQAMKALFVGMMMQQMGMYENPYGYDSVSVSYADFTNGKYAMTSYYDDEKFDYVLVDGTSVKEYGLYFDDEEDEYEGYYVSEYTGYKNEAQAKAALKVNENPLAYMLTMEFTGLGDKADVKGTVSELYELFTYNSAKNAYVGRVGAVDIGIVPDGTPMDMEIKVSDGKVVGYTADIALDMSIADMMGLDMDAEDEEDEEGGMPDMSAIYEGLSFEVSIVSEVNISDIGSTTVTVPADLDTQVLNTYTSYVIPDEDAYKAMFEGLLGEDTIAMSYNNAAGHVQAYFSAENNLLKIVEQNNEDDTKSAKVYWATEEGLKVYTANYNYDYGYAEFEGWSDAVTETISGDKTAALISKLPAEMQLYFNFNGKHMSEQFDLFEVSYYNIYRAKITFNEKECTVQLSYTYDEISQKLKFMEYALSEVGSYGPDIYVYVRTGNMNSDYEGLPEVDSETVTEAAWEALVQPWCNLKNVTIINGYEKTLVDIAADGSSGKIYHTGEDASSNWYITFEKNGDTYTATKYFFNETGMDYETWTPTGEWVKQTFSDLSYNEIIDMTGETVLNQLCGQGFYVDGDFKTLDEMSAYVKYNPMTGTYELEDYYVTLNFGEGTLVYNYYNTLSAKGTTVAGELPADVAAAQEWEF